MAEENAKPSYEDVLSCLKRSGGYVALKSKCTDLMKEHATELFKSKVAAALESKAVFEGVARKTNRRDLFEHARNHIEKRTQIMFEMEKEILSVLTMPAITALLDENIEAAIASARKKKNDETPVEKPVAPGAKNSEISKPTVPKKSSGVISKGDGDLLGMLLGSKAGGGGTSASKDVQSFAEKKLGISMTAVIGGQAKRTVQKSAPATPSSAQGKAKPELPPAAVVKPGPSTQADVPQSSKGPAEAGKESRSEQKKDPSERPKNSGAATSEPRKKADVKRNHDTAFGSDASDSNSSAFSSGSSSSSSSGSNSGSDSSSMSSSDESDDGSKGRKARRAKALAATSQGPASRKLRVVFNKKPDSHVEEPTSRNKGEGNGGEKGKAKPSGDGQEDSPVTKRSVRLRVRNRNLASTNPSSSLSAHDHDAAKIEDDKDGVKEDQPGANNKAAHAGNSSKEEDKANATTVPARGPVRRGRSASRLEPSGEDGQETADATTAAAEVPAAAARRKRPPEPADEPVRASKRLRAKVNTDTPGQDTNVNDSDAALQPDPPEVAEEEHAEGPTTRRRTGTRTANKEATPAAAEPQTDVVPHSAPVRATRRSSRGSNLGQNVADKAEETAVPSEPKPAPARPSARASRAAKKADETEKQDEAQGPAPTRMTRRSSMETKESAADPPAPARMTRRSSRGVDPSTEKGGKDSQPEAQGRPTRATRGSARVASKN